MKLPNFRLYETQATASMLLGILGVVCLLMLAAAVFWGFDIEAKSVTYNPDGSLGQFRQPGVYGATAGAMMVGLVAGILGFVSLGQKRNTKQGRSWLGMTLGALAVAVAPVLCAAWRLYSDPLIRDLG